MSGGAKIRHHLRSAAVSTGAYDHVKRALDAVWLRRHQRVGSFSQFGEDQVVLDRLGGDGLYLDIGSNHPYKANSTYLLYRNGWRGLATEPIRSLWVQHRSVRPRDACLNAAAGSRSGVGAFHELNPNGFSTFDQSAARRLCGERRAVETSTYDVPIVTATDAWIDAFPGEQCDFVSIDTEASSSTCSRVSTSRSSGPPWC